MTTAPTTFPRATVLVVDDTPDNLTVLGGLLQPAYRVRVATSGRRALEIAASDPQPDLILLDVMMPEMDGYRVMTELRASPATRDVPVIFVTALDSTEDEQRGLELGAVDYVTKPIRAGIVLARVQAQLELKRSRDRLRTQNAWLEAEVTRRVAMNQSIQDASIHAIAALAEMRDPETGNHLHRTRGYVATLARRLLRHPRFRATLTDQSIDLIARSAILHDIGKVGIPDQILRKPGKLTADEWAVMRTHAKLGAEAIEMAERDHAQPIEFLAYAKQIALHHHEKWDGSGYPDRLAGDAIPIPARLMALADVFDALVSRRVYKEPMSPQAARAIILNERGRHFDPDVVDAFDQAFDELCRIADQYADTEEDLRLKLKA
ncbi:MAG: two-component system response regulator [Myxococcota bacterium]